MIFKINIANAIAQKLYLAGLVLASPAFPPLDEKTRNIIASRIFIPTGYKLLIPNDYSRAKKIKKQILISGKDCLGLDDIEVKQFPQTNALILKDGLEILLDKHHSSIAGYLSEQSNIINSDYDVFIIAGIGELGESLGNILVIGDQFDSKVGFLVILEEVLHSILSIPNKESLGMSNVEDNLYIESYIGANLLKLTELLEYDIDIVNSVIYDWQGGRRKELVQYLTTYKFLD